MKLSVIACFVSSETPDAEMNSLLLLLKHDLWQVAILLVKQQEEPKLRRILFEVLVSAAAKVNKPTETFSPDFDTVVGLRMAQTGGSDQ